MNLNDSSAILAELLEAERKVRLRLLSKNLSKDEKKQLNALLKHIEAAKNALTQSTGSKDFGKKLTDLLWLVDQYLRLLQILN